MSFKFDYRANDDKDAVLYQLFEDGNLLTEQYDAVNVGVALAQMANNSIRHLLTEIEALKAERDAYKQAYEQAMLAGSDDTTADSFNEYYLAQANREGSGWWNLVETSQASDDAHDTPAFVSSDALEELKAELTDITEPIPYLDDDGEVA